MKKEGQILVIVLIVLMILGITIVGVTNNLIADTKESYQNTEYDSLYSIAESQVLNIAQNLDVKSSNFSRDISEILTQAGYPIDDIDCSVPSSIGVDIIRAYRCQISDIDSNDANVYVDFLVEDSANLENIEVGKDETVTYKLAPDAGTYGTFSISLTDNDGQPFNDPAAIEVILDFEYMGFDGVTRFSSVRGIHRVNSSSPFGSATNIFFTDIAALGSTFTFNLDESIDSITDPNIYTYSFVSGSVRPQGLRFKPIIPVSGPASLSISVSANPIGNIAQSRTIIATSYKLNSNDELFGPQPVVEGTIPFFKSPAIFDYVLRTGGEVN